MSRPSFGKMQREKERRAKAAAKAERRAQRSNEPDDEGPAEETGPVVDQAILLDQLAKLHQSYDDGAIEFEAFMEAKDEITQRLQV